MASSLSSLGLGSDGALSYDVIDQLRAVDEKAQISPIDAKLEKNTTKTSDLSILTTMTATLKSATSTLSDEMSYLKRTASLSNTAVSVTAASGSGVQDFDMRVDQLAQRDIFQTDGFTSETSALGLTSGTFSIMIGSTTYDIPTTSTMSLSDLKEKINDIAGEKVTASVLNVGGTNPQRLVIKSDATGEDNLLTFTASDASILEDLGLDATSIAAGTGSNHLQIAQNSVFLYNGVSIERSSNTIDDLVVGLSITLNTKQDTDEKTTVSITQDTSDIKSNLESLVSSYNDLISNLNETTKYDSDSKASGTFQGVSQITALSSEIRRQLLQVNALGKSLVDYGITLNESGLLEFNSISFDEKINADSTDVEAFFRGTTDEDGTLNNGFFTDFNDMLGRYITGDDSILTLYEKFLSSEKTSLTKERVTTVGRLDDRYETMASRFAAYDTIINKLNNQFSALSMMIEASYNSN